MQPPCQLAPALLPECFTAELLFLLVQYRGEIELVGDRSLTSTPESGTFEPPIGTKVPIVTTALRPAAPDASTPGATTQCFSHRFARLFAEQSPLDEHELMTAGAQFSRTQRPSRETPPSGASASSQRSPSAQSDSSSQGIGKKLVSVAFGPSFGPALAGTAVA